ncbi:MAG: hypothetical protein XD78_0846 [Desulfotomaculum sp. 46_296]|nr:MAG: hypothetical protein XD78_0846 [Desulfotomaculum sp. 46_296]
MRKNAVNGVYCILLRQGLEFILPFVIISIVF